MGDMSQEQSMEDILSTIRRVIAREDGRAELTAAVEAATVEAAASGSAASGAGATGMAAALPDDGATPPSPVLRKRRAANGGAVPASGSTPSATAPAMDARTPAEPGTALADEPADPVDAARAAPSAHPSFDEDGDDVLLLGPASLAAGPADRPEAPLISELGAAATRHALEALNAAAHPPRADTGSATTIATGVPIEAVVIEALRPMLRQWIDANLPAMVETMVAREIARITGR